MANAFSKEERVAFEDLVIGFEDGLVMSKVAGVYKVADVTMERSNDTISRPVPYILTSNSGNDATSNFTDKTQLSVPASIDTRKHVAWALTDTELRDALQENRLGKAAAQRLASDINVSLMNEAANRGTVVVTSGSAASGHSSITPFETALNRVGVPMGDRALFLSSATYNALASDLAGKFIPGKARTAIEKSFIGDYAGFECYKLDYANRLTGQAGTGWLVNGASQNHTPSATSSNQNTDNRTQTLTVDTGSGTIAEGDCFTIAGVNEVHHITKADTGTLKSFRVVSRDSATQWTITPAIISSGDYQNVSAAPADNAAITITNTTTADVNVFFHKDALELVAGGLVIPTSGSVAAMKATTENGIQITFQKQWDVNISRYKFRVDISYGVVSLNREMMGIGLFSQT
jgi:hypothetical protein